MIVGENRGGVQRIVKGVIHDSILVAGLMASHVRVSGRGELLTLGTQSGGRGRCSRGG